MINEKFSGIFDSVCEVKTRNPKILQLTDMQIIDATQQRYEGRLCEREIVRWQPESMDANCLDAIRRLVDASKPDLIVVTGDIVYGEFDDSGRIQKIFMDFMDGFGIPWAPIFGNHDNESAIGVDAQCDYLESLPNCLFKRGNVTGFGNYTVGVFCGGEPVYALYMLDSHGCGAGFEKKTRIAPGLAEDQLALMFDTAKRAWETNGKPVPGLAAYHIPDVTFVNAINAKNYLANGFGEIGVTVPARDGDSGRIMENIWAFGTPENYCGMLTAAGINTLLTGHYHKINSVILYDGILTVFGTKTGVYDYHDDGMLGGTLLTVGEKTAAEQIYIR